MATLADVDSEALSSILTSESVTLLPSDFDTPIHIHERLLSSVSPALGVTCQRSWEELNSKVYKFLKDDDGFHGEVTKELLICFVRWAYLGDYSTESVGISSFVKERAVVEDEWQKRTIASNKCRKCGRRDYDIEEIEVPKFDPYEVANEETVKSTDSANGLDTGEGPCTNPTNSLSPLFLHIQLYVFANIYLIESLKVVSKRKIIDYLKKVDNSPSKGTYTAVIFVLLDHASSYLTEDDPLLNWLARYASWNLIALREDVARLENLLGKGDGKFAGLLIRHVVPSQKSPFVPV